MLPVPGVLIPLIGETLRWCHFSAHSTRSIRAKNLLLRAIDSATG